MPPNSVSIKRLVHPVTFEDQQAAAGALALEEPRQHFVGAVALGDPIRLVRRSRECR